MASHGVRIKYKQYSIIFCSILVLFTPAFSVHAEHYGYPVIIVPGMLASFDKKLLYQDVEDNKWGFAPFGNVYKSLINELKIYGYEEGKSLFIAYYDWRKPVSENWQKYLKPKIDEAKRISGEDKVDIVAHSMGGLFSRAYIQSDNYENDVNKFAMLGTPNYGASEAYVAWEGGLYPSSWNAVYISYFKSIQFILSFVRNKHLPPPLSFREFFPSIRDLLPTTPFVKNGNDLLELSDMADKNDFLSDLNNSIDLLKTRVETRIYAGHTGQTMDTIAIGGICTIEDNQNQRWRDGHPNPDPPVAESAQGDETVLISSAFIPDANQETLDGTPHTKLPDDARSSVAWFLSPPFQMQRPVSSVLAYAKHYLTNTFSARAGGDEYIAPDSMLSFTVSPNVNFEVIDPDGKILSREKNELGEDNANFDDDPADSEDIILVTIRNPKAGKYTLKITGNTAGNYYVDSTFVNDNGVFDDSNEGTIKVSEAITVEEVVSETEGIKSNQKLSEVVTDLQRILATLFDKKNKDQQGLNKEQYKTLIEPLDKLQYLVRVYEAVPNIEKKDKTTHTLKQIEEQRNNFAKEVDKMIAKGKINQQTVGVLTELKRRLLGAVLVLH